MKSIIKIAAIGAATIVSVSSSMAGAATVLVNNASFEGPVLASNSFQDGQEIPGWTKVANQQGPALAGVQNFGNNNYFRPADGNQVVYINRSSIVQDLGALLANTVYTLTVAAGTQANYGQGSTGSFGFSNGGNQEYASTVAVPLLVGSMSDFTTSFTSGANATGNLFIRLSNRSGDQVIYDNVRVTAVSAVAAVPEASTWAMMLVGFGGIGFAMRRRAKVRTRVAYAI